MSFTGKAKDITKQIESAITPLGDVVKKLGSEMEKIYKPVDKKVVVIDGQEYIMSLIIDGRVIINFGDLKTADKYFKDPKKYSQLEMDKNTDEAIKLGENKKEKDWQQKSWRKRLMKK
jgi:hypothetical protein